jgi:hypothetical protein
MISRRIRLIILAIATALLILSPHAGSQRSFAQSPADSPCFYRTADGTVVDLQTLCGQTAPGAVPIAPVSLPNTSVAPGNITNVVNPAMQITPPDDPGVLYLSNSGGPDQGAIAASAAEQ